MQPTVQDLEQRSAPPQVLSPAPAAAPSRQGLRSRPQAPARVLTPYGWPVPSSLSREPEEARAQILLPAFDELMLEKARVISGRFPMAEAQYRELANGEEVDLPHFERVFRRASALASVPNVQDAPDYDS